MHFLDKRIKVICDELRRLQRKQKFPVTDWKYKEGNYIHPQDAEAAGEEWKDFDGKTMYWYGPDRHYWFKTVYKVPQEMDGKRLWVYVMTNINEWDDAKNPQFLLFVNGVATQGSLLTGKHRYAIMVTDVAQLMFPYGGNKNAANTNYYETGHY